MLPTVVTVARHYKRADAPVDTEDTSVETMDVEDFVVAPARVKLELGITMNTGNYESARISVGIEVPCYREEIDEAYKNWLKYAKERIIEEQQEIQQWARTRGSRNNAPF